MPRCFSSACAASNCRNEDDKPLRSASRRHLLRRSDRPVDSNRCLAAPVDLNRDATRSFRQIPCRSVASCHAAGGMAGAIGGSRSSGERMGWANTRQAEDRARFARIAGDRGRGGSGELVSIGQRFPWTCEGRRGGDCRGGGAGQAHGPREHADAVSRVQTFPGSQRICQGRRIRPPDARRCRCAREGRRRARCPRGPGTGE